MADESAAKELENPDTKPEEQADPEGLDAAQGAELSGPEAVNEELPPEEPEPVFTWQASEYVHHQKSMTWYMIVGLATVVLIGAAVWLRLWLEIGVFVAAAVALVVYANKPPRTLLYELSGEGIRIDEKFYPFSDFRSFGVVVDDDWQSIDLEPAKRFSPRLVLVFGDENFNEIVDHLELHLPRADRDPDLVERLTRYFRF